MYMYYMCDSVTLFVLHYAAQVHPWCKSLYIADCRWGHQWTGLSGETLSLASYLYMHHNLYMYMYIIYIIIYMYMFNV